MAPACCCYVHPAFRGRGYGLAASDVQKLRRRFPGDDVADELIVRDFDAAVAWTTSPGVIVRLKTVMAVPEDLELVCAIDP